MSGPPTADQIVEREVRELVRQRGLDPGDSDAPAVRRLIDEVVADYAERRLVASMPPLADPGQVAKSVADRVVGMGPLQPYFDDPEVEEVWINEPGRVFVAKAGRPQLTTTVLAEQQVHDLVELMLRASGRRVDLSSPFVVKYTTGMDVGIYTRLSVAKDSREATGEAIDRQLDRCRALADAKGWRVAEHYSDVDVGAYRAPGRKRPPERAEFERMLADVQAGHIGGLVFFKLDRLVRDHGDFERVLAVCEAHGAKLACVVDAIDTSTPTGEAMARTMVTFSRLESQTTALRVAARKEQNARAGKPAVSAWRPYGYTWNGLELVGEEAAVLRLAGERLLAGWSLREVTRAANAAGAVGTTGRPFNTTRLKKILLSPRVAGLRAYKGEVVAEGAWPAVFDRETWEQIRLVLTDAGRGANRPGRPPRWLLVGGLARCGYEDCGAPLMVKPTGGRGHARYVCDTNRPGRAGCGRIAVSAPKLEELVAELLFARDWRHLDTRAAQAGVEVDLAAEQAAAKLRLVEVGRLHARGRIGTEEWLTQRDELADQVAELQQLLDEARRASADATLAAGSAALREAWPGMTLEQRRAAVARVLVCVLVKPAGRRLGSQLDADRVEPIWRQ
jgi:DNA invertase Pin-like site-specific DNA recombinase